MMELIEDTPYFTIQYDPETKCIIHTWKGYASPKTFRASVEKIIEAFRTHETEFIISNTKNAKVVDENDVQWVSQEINPMLIQEGLKKVAFVVPQNLLARWSLEHFLEDIENQPLDVRLFDDVYQAKTWIAEAQG